MTLQDPVLDYIVELARNRIQPTRILLFGSRARGDHRERSDYDLAFEFPIAFEMHWPKFVLDAQENSPTLCGLDLINLREIRAELRDRILKEGKDLEI
jgi:predicted nucleotidyltransferase